MYLVFGYTSKNRSSMCSRRITPNVGGEKVTVVQEAMDIDGNRQAWPAELTSSSAMAERPRELDQRFQVGVSLRLNYTLNGYFSSHCDMTQFTLTHHMVNKPFLLLGLKTA